MTKLARKFSIDCGYSSFSVCEAKDLADLGETDFDKHNIKIMPGLEDKVFLEVLWHEIFHVILELSGFGGHPEEEDPMFLLPPISNEELTTRITRTLMMVLKYNPHLKEYL